MRRRLYAFFIVAIAIAGGGAFAVTRRAAAPAPAAAASVPIVAGQVTSQDVPIYLRGIGTVIAYNTDVVRSQIQGELTQIAFKGRPGRSCRRSARPDRSASLSGATRPGHRNPRSRPGAVDQFARQPGSLHPARRQRLRDAAAARYQKAQVAQLQNAVKSDNSLIEQAQVQLEYTRLTSPISVSPASGRSMSATSFIRPTPMDWSSSPRSNRSR